MVRITTSGKKKIQKLIKDKMVEALGNARQEVPVDTGTLKNSLKVVQDGEFAYKLGSDLPYTYHVEFGTQNQSPHPFLRPAVRRLGER